jgi:6-phosphogluconate dehydrogenase
MQLGMIGLGRMGANLTRRLMRDGHQMVVWNRAPAPTATLAAEGAVGTESIADLAARLDLPRAVWIMVPAAVTGQVVADVAAVLESGDTIIDGGNSYYRDDIARAGDLAAKGIHYVDVGTSGGVFGLERGYCLMIGGEDDVVRRLEPIFATIAPGVDAAPRTPGRMGDVVQSERGYLHCGGNGAGHFVKMVHNGIEYGIMAAYAEGLDILRNADVGLRDRAGDAETAPLDHPEFYRYTINTAEVAEVWRRGSVVGSWLLDLTAAALHGSADLEEFSGRVSDSGEGRWTSIAAIEEGIPAYVLTAAVYERFSSRGEGTYANRVLSAMRRQFGGHVEVPAGD